MCDMFNRAGIDYQLAYHHNYYFDDMVDYQLTTFLIRY